EKDAWGGVLEAHSAREPEVPLAQTLVWAEAIDAVHGLAYAVFSPDEGVGGLLFSEQGQRFECVNGPLLAWDEPSASPRQLATFAMAVSKLDRRFETLSLRPRWDRSRLAERLSHLPIAPHAIDHAATRLLRLRPG